jgi:hypothetical protein
MLTEPIDKCAHAHDLGDRLAHAIQDVMGAVVGAATAKAVMGAVVGGGGEVGGDSGGLGSDLKYLYRNECAT